MSDQLLVTARLASPLAGEAPQLDALLEYLLSLYHHKGEPGYKIDRALPAPPQSQIPIPIPRKTVFQKVLKWSETEDGFFGWVERTATWEVARCSDPIYPEPTSEGREYVNKRLATENAGLLAPASRTVVSTTNTWTKSYRIPLRIRRVPCVRWFATGHRRQLLCLLRRCPAIGKKVSVGYGRIAEWTVERIDRDYTWFAPWPEHGTVLMRTLPAGDWLPADLIGTRGDFGAACPPYWHQERWCKIVRPS